MLGELHDSLRAGNYHPAPVRRVEIPKPDGTKRQLEAVIARLNQFLRGWGNYFRTGNAARKFRQLDRYVAWRLHRLLVKKRGRSLHAGQADRWTEAWFHDQGLHKLVGTIRYPKAA